MCEFWSRRVTSGDTDERSLETYPTDTHGSIPGQSAVPTKVRVYQLLLGAVRPKFHSAFVCSDQGSGCDMIRSQHLSA